MSASSRPGGTRRLATLRVEGRLYGIEAGSVQEVLGPVALTRLPLAAPAVAGLMNLRGRIVTVLDLRRCLGLPARAAATGAVNLVLRPADNPMGLLADEIGEVLEVDASAWSSRPDTAQGPEAELISGVYRLENELLCVLDADAVRARAAA
jgi:purine-binding chemotaxis protein CheW